MHETYFLLSVPDSTLYSLGEEKINFRTYYIAKAKGCDTQIDGWTDAQTKGKSVTS
jgi:hypothetical protein